MEDRLRSKPLNKIAIAVLIENARTHYPDDSSPLTA